MPISMHTRRLIQPYHVRFPMRTARSYKKVPGLTERCKELAGVLRTRTYVDLPQPPRTAEIPFSIQQRIFQRAGSHMFRCTHCGQPEVFYPGDGHRHGVCRDCQGQFALTLDGQYLPVTSCWRDANGNLWSSEAAWDSHLPDVDEFDEFDEEDDDDDERSIAGYHAHPGRANKMCYHAPDADDPWAKDVVLIGFEWEYNAVNSFSRTKSYHKLNETTYCFGEEDGSLSDSRGMEVVTGWSTLGTVCRWAREIGQCIEVGDIEDAGLHVNISGLTNLQLAKLITFLSRNFQLTTRIGGRSSSYYAAQQSGRLGDWLYKTRRGASSGLGTLAPSTDKYSTCNIRSNGRVAEIRIFNSSKRAEAVVHRIQYAWLAAQFVRQPGLNLSERNFKQFLADNPWAVRGARDLLKAFPDLCPTAFVKRPKKVPA